MHNKKTIFKVQQKGADSWCDLGFGEPQKAIFVILEKASIELTSRQIEGRFASWRMTHQRLDLSPPMTEVLPVRAGRVDETS